MNRKKSEAKLARVQKFVAKLDEGLCEKQAKAQVSRMIKSLPADEVWDVPDRDATLDDARRHALAAAGLKFESIGRLLVDRIETDPRVRRQLAFVVGKMSASQKQYEDALLSYLDAMMPAAVRLAALQALCTAIDDTNEVAEILVCLLGMVLEDEAAVDLIVRRLGWHLMESEDAVAQVLSFLNKGIRDFHRTHLENVLARVVEVDRGVIASLLSRRHEGDPWVRQRLARIIVRSPLLAESLTEVGATATNPNLQKVVYALGESDGFDELVTLCREALEDAEEGVRCGALLALAKYGPAAKRAFNDILSIAVDDRSDIVRAAAIRALIRIDLRKMQNVVSEMAMEATDLGDQPRLLRLDLLLREAFPDGERAATT